MKIKRYRFRLLVLLVLMTTGLVFLIERLRQLQIDNQKIWENNIPGERTETVRLPAVRGNVIDRNGVILATNKRNYELDINLEEVKRYYQEGWDTPLEREVVGSRKGGMTGTRKETDIAAIANTTILPRLKSFGIEKSVSDSSLRSHYNTHKGLIGYNYSKNLSFEQFCVLSENLESLPGAEVSVRPRRIYPMGALAGHLLGYTKEWKKGDIPEYEQGRFTHYQGDMYGDTGVELTMNDYLKGVPGKRTISRGPRQVFLGVKDEEDPSAGAEVRLTIDAGLQTYVEKLLRQIGRGGLTVIDVETGEILAMASVPTIDPNDFTSSFTQKQFDYYRLNKAAPLLNNAVQQHQPGSVYKLPVALAAAQANNLGYRHKCNGYETYGRSGDVKIRCWNTSGHGTLSMSSAIQRSCNPYFMALANNLGSKRVVDMFGLLGFGQKTGIAITGEEAGIVPGSLQWRRHIRPGETFTPANLAQLSIGQDTSGCSTLQMAAATAAIANGGKYMKPRIIKSVIHPDRGSLIEDTPTMKLDLLQEGLSSGDLQLIRKGMWRVVNEQGGTANGIKFSSTIEVAAKTGTAQTVEFGRRSNNAWTTAFAPYDKPKYAVCAVVLGGQSGGAVAGPLIRETLRALFTDTTLSAEKLSNYRGHISEIEALSLAPMTGTQQAAPAAEDEQQPPTE